MHTTIQKLMDETKNVAQGMKKIGQGEVNDEGKRWFQQFRDNHKSIQ